MAKIKEEKQGIDKILADLESKFGLGKLKKKNLQL